MTHEEELDACVCGHSRIDHVSDIFGKFYDDCADCDCEEFRRQGDQEPADDADAWSGGFAEDL